MGWNQVELEGLGDAFTGGRFGIDLGRLKRQRRAAGLSPADAAQLAFIERRDPIQPGFLRGSAEILGQLYQMAPEAITMAEATLCDLRKNTSATKLPTSGESRQARASVSVLRGDQPFIS